MTCPLKLFSLYFFVQNCNQPTNYLPLVVTPLTLLLPRRLLEDTACKKRRSQALLLTPQAEGKQWLARFHKMAVAGGSAATQVTGLESFDSWPMTTQEDPDSMLFLRFRSIQG